MAGFLVVGELAQVPHYPETRTAPGATGAWVKSKRMYLIRGSVGA